MKQRLVQHVRVGATVLFVVLCCFALFLIIQGDGASITGALVAVPSGGNGSSGLNPPEDTNRELTEPPESFVTGAESNVSVCSFLNTAGTTYVLQNNISVSGTCFATQTSNIIFDGNGYTISDPSPSTDASAFGNWAGTGIHHNITVKNLVLVDYDKSIIFSFDGLATNYTFENITIDGVDQSGSGSWGLYLENISSATIRHYDSDTYWPGVYSVDNDNITVVNATINSSVSNGVHFVHTDNSSVSAVASNSGNRGVSLHNSKNNRFENSSFNSSDRTLYLEVGSNNNTFVNVSARSTTDFASYILVVNDTTIEQSSLVSETLAAMRAENASRVNYSDIDVFSPLTSIIHIGCDHCVVTQANSTANTTGFGTYIKESDNHTYIHSNITTKTAEGLVMINVTNSLFHNLIINSSSTAIEDLTGENNTLSNITAITPGFGATFSSSENMTVVDSNITTTSTSALRINYTHNSRFFNNTFVSPTTAVSFNNSDNTSFRGNTIQGTMTGVHLENSKNFTILNNSITGGTTALLLNISDNYTVNDSNVYSGRVTGTLQNLFVNTSNAFLLGAVTGTITFLMATSDKLEISDSTVSLENMTIVTSTGSGITLNNASNSVINVVNINSSSFVAVSINQSNNVTVNNISVFNASSFLTVRDSQSFVLADATSSLLTDDGVKLINTSDSTLLRNSLQVADIGITVEDSSNIVMEDNTVTSTGDNVLIIDVGVGENYSFSHNYFEILPGTSSGNSVVDFGSVSNNVTNVTMINNTMVANGLTDIATNVENVLSSLFENNTFQHHNSTLSIGLRLDGAEDNIFRGNYVSMGYNPRGVYLTFNNVNNTFIDTVVNASDPDYSNRSRPVYGDRLIWIGRHSSENNTFVNTSLYFHIPDPEDLAFSGQAWIRHTNSSAVGTYISNNSFFNTTFSTQHGSMFFSDELIIQTAGVYLFNDTYIAYNYTAVNATVNSDLNQSATITIKNITVTNPVVRVDETLDGSFEDCSSCTNLSYANSTATFIVPGFSAYAVSGDTGDEPTSGSGGGPPYVGVIPAAGIADPPLNLTIIRKPVITAPAADLPLEILQPYILDPSYLLSSIEDLLPSFIKGATLQPLVEVIVLLPDDLFSPQVFNEPPTEESLAVGEKSGAQSADGVGYASTPESSFVSVNVGSERLPWISRTFFLSAETIRPKIFGLSCPWCWLLWWILLAIVLLTIIVVILIRKERNDKKK